MERDILSTVPGPLSLVTTDLDPLKCTVHNYLRYLYKTEKKDFDIYERDWNSTKKDRYRSKERTRQVLRFLRGSFNLYFKNKRLAANAKFTRLAYVYLPFFQP